MKNYWFLYSLDTGEIYNDPYFGYAKQWTNIPDRCGLIGPFSEDVADNTIKDAYDNPSHYIIQNNEILPKSNIIDLQLQTAKNNKINEIENACVSSISPFNSSALNTLHTYLADDESMKLLSAEYAFVIGPDYDNNLIPWYTIEDGYQNHTAQQFRKVYIDGRSYVQKMKLKKDTKEKQVNACTSISQVQTIIWNNTTPPSIPTGLSGTAKTGEVDLTWTANTDVTMIGGGGYNVYNGTTKVNTSLITSASYNLAGLPSGTAVTLSIAAVDTDGNESAQSISVTITPL